MDHVDEGVAEGHRPEAGLGDTEATAAEGTDAHHGIL